jgi:hypothetical protein
MGTRKTSPRILAKLQAEHDQLVVEACDYALRILNDRTCAELQLPQSRRARKILEAVKRDPKWMRGKFA